VGVVLYLFCAVIFVLVVGWMIYVLPVPGALSAWELTGAFIPALILAGGVLALMSALWGLGRLAEWIVRRLRRSGR